jgi:hypothetical protein
MSSPNRSKSLFRLIYDLAQLRVLRLSPAKVAVKTKIIVNRMANKGSCGKRWPQMRAELEKTLGPLAADDVVMTNAPNHASVLAREAVGEGYLGWCRSAATVLSMK